MKKTAPKGALLRKIAPAVIILRRKIIKTKTIKTVTMTAFATIVKPLSW